MVFVVGSGVPLIAMVKCINVHLCTRIQDGGQEERRDTVTFQVQGGGGEKNVWMCISVVGIQK